MVPHLSLTKHNIIDTFRLLSQKSAPTYCDQITFIDLKFTILKSFQNFQRYDLIIVPEYSSSERFARGKLTPLIIQAKEEGQSNVELRG